MEKEPPNRIRELRTAKCWAMERLAVESGVSFRQVQRIESGATASPRHDTLSKIAAALNVSIDDLEIGRRQKGVVTTSA